MKELPLRMRDKLFHDFILPEEAREIREAIDGYNFLSRHAGDNSMAWTGREHT